THCSVCWPPPWLLLSTLVSLWELAGSVVARASQSQDFGLNRLTASAMALVRDIQPSKYRALVAAERATPFARTSRSDIREGFTCRHSFACAVLPWPRRCSLRSPAPLPKARTPPNPRRQASRALGSLE